MHVRILAAATLASGLATLVVSQSSADDKKKVDKITCEEFLAMDPSDQQRVAYWVDGYYSAKNESAVGSVAYDKFGQPIGALVDDCKATPKATLWEKIKKHL
jgi:hypothetical protein